MTIKCNNDVCQKAASFNYKDERPIYCGSHKLTNMINVRDKTCYINECSRKPCFNLPDKKTGLYCSDHKLEEMIDVKHKKCKFDGCTKRPSYNLPDKKTGLYCTAHKLDGMINIISTTKCNNINCDKKPCFNYHDKSEGIYCRDHKEEGMINVFDKKCIYKNCIKIPCYNFSTEKKSIYCRDHKFEGMINFKFNECNEIECDKLACYNFNDEKKGKYCYIHKLQEMVDVTHQKCLSDLCEVRPYKNKYQGYCVRCFLHNFPDEPISRNYRIKERHVTDFLKINFPHIDFIFDKIVGGCSKRRPDVYADLLTHVLIIEINENKHESYDTTCQTVRINELYEDFGWRPLVFINFNPDNFIDDNKKTIKSPFKVDSRTGILIIDKNKTTEWNNRLEKLKNVVDVHLKNVPDDNIFIYLFYNMHS